MKTTLIFRRNLRLLKWLLPLSLILIVIAYEIGPSVWIYNSRGYNFHLTIEIFLFGTIGPLIAFILLELLIRWLDEKETADFQANLLAEARIRDIEVRQLNDNTLQVLFATSLLIDTIKAERSDLPPDTVNQIEVTKQALNESIRQINYQLST